MFKDKVALVTGGTSGIGRSTAVAFGKEGAKVIIAARRENLGTEVVEEISNSGGEAIFIRTDVRKPEDIDHLFKTIIEKYGRLDIAFNNAGASLLHVPTAAKTTLAEWDLVMEANMRGIWLCMKQEIEQMLKQGGGIIVNTASIFVALFRGIVFYDRERSCYRRRAGYPFLTGPLLYFNLS